MSVQPTLAEFGAEMPSDSNASPMFVPSEWGEVARQRLQRRRITEREFRSLVKSRLLEAMRTTYWQAIRAYAEKRRMPVQDIGERLGVAASTAWRWEQGIVVPDADTILAALVIALHVEWPQVGFPELRQVHWEMTAETLHQISEHELGAPIKDRMIPRDYVCLRIFFTLEVSRAMAQALVRTPPFIPESLIKHPIFKEVARQMRHHWPSAATITPAEVHAIVKVWALPIALFATGIANANWWCRPPKDKLNGPA